MENALVTKYPVFSPDPIDTSEFDSGTMSVRIPNPYAANVDANGEVLPSAMVTVTCSVVNRVATCSVVNFQVDLAEPVVDYLAGGDVNVAYTCMVTVSGTVTATCVSETHVAYALDSTLVPGGDCMNVIQQLLVDPATGCDQSYDLTVQHKGPVPGDGGVCATAYAPN